MSHSVESQGDRLKVTDSKGKVVQFPAIWLRDHCRCEQCYNLTTLQRKLDFNLVPADIKLGACTARGDALTVLWPDNHSSEYSLSWLESVTHDKYLQKQERHPKLWTKEDVTSLAVAHVPCRELLESGDGVFKLVKSLVDFGVGFVEEVAPDLTSTEAVVQRVAHVQHTLFGGMWEFSDSLDHSDTAYTKEALGEHTDNTYFTEAAGLQILHCLQHDGTGGENLLVDGYKAVANLKENHPDTFQRLTTTLVEGEYREPGYHHTFLAPVIRLHPLTGQVEQIRFNLNDRAPLSSIPASDVPQHYEDLRLLSSSLRDSALQWWVKLRPGTVLFFDNFRTLHGRSAYTGHRTMCGCYVGRGDFLSKARTLGLL